MAIQARMDAGAEDKINTWIEGGNYAYVKQSGPSYLTSTSSTSKTSGE